MNVEHAFKSVFVKGYTKMECKNMITFFSEDPESPICR